MTMKKQTINHFWQVFRLQLKVGVQGAESNVAGVCSQVQQSWQCGAGQTDVPAVDGQCNPVSLQSLSLPAIPMHSSNTCC